MRLILSEGRAEVRMPRYTFSRGVITYLKVRNLAIVEELAIEPGPGLNVLTGETGAGKSLLIDSLEFLRGARGSTEMIRAGSDRMTAEAVFHLPKKLRAQLDELGIECEEGDPIELIVRREIAAGGRGRVLINGSPLAVRELGSSSSASLLSLHASALPRSSSEHNTRSPRAEVDLENVEVSSLGFIMGVSPCRASPHQRPARVATRTCRSTPFHCAGRAARMLSP